MEKRFSSADELLALAAFYVNGHGTEILLEDDCDLEAPEDVRGWLSLDQIHQDYGVDWRRYRVIDCGAGFGSHSFSNDEISQSYKPTRLATRSVSGDHRLVHSVHRILASFLFLDHLNDLFVSETRLHLSVLLLGGHYTKLEEIDGLRSLDQLDQLEYLHDVIEGTARELESEWNQNRCGLYS